MSQTKNANASGNKQAEQTRMSQKEINLQAKKKARAEHKKSLKDKTQEDVQTAPKPKNKKDNVKDKTLEETVKAIRESKYQYLEGATDKDKKAFRRKARETKEKFELDIQKLSESKDPKDAAELKAKQKEYATWEKETYVQLD